MLEALRRYYEHDNANVHRGIHELSNRATAAFEAARARAAQFINARSADEIIFTRGTTEGINLVAQAWGSKHAQAPATRSCSPRWSTTATSSPGNCWPSAPARKLVYLPITGDIGLLDLSRLDECLTKEVKLFALTHISNSLGTINPVADLCARARKLGVTTLVDAAQSAGHRPLDVQDIGCDFLAFSGHKMCGPTGIGVLYGRQEVLEDHAALSGRRRDDSERGFSAEHLEARPAQVRGRHARHLRRHRPARGDGLPRRRSGAHNIAQHDQELGAYAYAQLSRLKSGIRLFGPHIGRAGLVSFLLKDVHAHDVVTVADQRGVALRGGHHCNQPLMRKLGVESTARASFYFYNTTDEIDRFVEVLGEIQKFFGAS